MKPFSPPGALAGHTISVALPRGPMYDGFFIKAGGRGFSLRRIKDVRLMADGRDLLRYEDARMLKHLNEWHSFPHRWPWPGTRGRQHANLCLWVLLKSAGLQDLRLELSLDAEYRAPKIEICGTEAMAIQDRAA